MAVGGQVHRQLRGGCRVVEDGLDLVAGGALERADRTALGESVEHVVDAIDVAAAAALVNGHDEH